MEEAYYKLLNDIIRGYNRRTPSKISSLRNNQIFVFGTDKNGSQKYGAAGMAAKYFGAKAGVVEGATGMCYALPTKDFTKKELASAVARFEQYVRANMQYTYIVTAVGCGHAGFDVDTVANMFIGLIGLSNVMLPEVFLKVYRTKCHWYFENECLSKANNNIVVESPEEIFMYFDERVHNVVRYLLKNNIPFNKDGGFSIIDDNGIVIAEAELGIEKEKIVFIPFNDQSSVTFRNHGYSIYTPEEYLKLKEK